MKKVLNVGIGGVSFSLDEDAYDRLSLYFSSFRSMLSGQDNVKPDEVMEDLEERVAEILMSKLDSRSKVVSLPLIEEIVLQLGMPDGSPEPGTGNYDREEKGKERPIRKFYRDIDGRKVAGVCSGLSLYFNVDVFVFRLLFVILFVCAASGMLIYLIFWIAAPKAVTPAQKCELRGIPATAENMSKFSRHGK